MHKPYLFYKEDTVRVYCGDCRPFMKLLPDKSIPLLFADLPYGINLEYDSPFQDTQEYYDEMMDALLTDGLRISRTMIVTPGGYTNVEKWKQRCRDKNIDWFRFCWYKGALAHRSKCGFAHWEEVLIFGKIMASIPDFIFASPEFDTTEHVCPKPEKLLAFFINAYTKKNELVFDPFGGWGTTVVVAKKLNRRGLTIELSKTYCEKIAKRLSQTIVIPEQSEELNNQTTLFKEPE